MTNIISAEMADVPGFDRPVCFEVVDGQLVDSDDLLCIIKQTMLDVGLDEQSVRRFLVEFAEAQEKIPTRLN